MAQTALVTGASRGIGKAIALELAKQGYQIAINYLSNGQAAEQVVSEIQALGGQAIAVQANVAQPQEQDKLITQTLAAFQGIDVLVNNAGITRDNLLMRMKAEEWQEVIQTNLISVYRMAQLVSEQMLSQGHGKIINISSVVGVHGNAGQANYASAKAGVISLSKVLARELMPTIQVNCIAPGLVQTDMTARFDLSKLSGSKLGRAAQPDDIAKAVAWLVGADYVTGQVIEIDGGLSLWSDVQSLAA